MSMKKTAFWILESKTVNRYTVCMSFLKSLRCRKATQTKVNDTQLYSLEKLLSLHN